MVGLRQREISGFPTEDLDGLAQFPEFPLQGCDSFLLLCRQRGSRAMIPLRMPCRQPTRDAATLFETQVEYLK